MIKEFEFYHGAVFTSLIHNSRGEISIRSFGTKGNASYIVDEAIGLYIKHSSKRMSPWHFYFTSGHQKEILQMKSKFSKIFLILVCGDDGVVTLKYEEIKDVFNKGKEEWISAKRSPRKEYSIKARAGILSCKIGKSDFPRRIFENLQLPVDVDQLGSDQL